MPQIQSIYPQTFPFDNVKRVQGHAEIGTQYSVDLSDESKTDAGSVDWLFFPRNDAELAGVVDEMCVRHIPVTVAGGRTGLVGGCIAAGGALVSMVYFDPILSFIMKRLEQNGAFVCKRTSRSKPCRTL